MASHEEDPNEQSRRTYSIDLALELERQLGDDLTSSTAGSKNERPQSLDPHILANLVMHLRHSVEEITKERDQLLVAMSNATSQSAEYKDGLQLMTEKCSKFELQLAEAKKKNKDDEDSIAMLRSKVDESRRAVMRLQTETRENRRMSYVQPPPDTPRIGLPSFPNPSNKRASFTPLTGSGVRSQHSEARSSSESIGNTPINSYPEYATNSRRLSGIFGRNSPQPDSQDGDASAEIVATLRRETCSLKAELEDVKHELAEAKEAREASETCVQALRRFITENNVGGADPAPKETPATLPRMPVVAHGNEPDSKNLKRNGSTPSWGFRLWKGDNGALKPSTASSSTGPSPNSSIAEPLSKKLGGFFSSRTNTTSTAPDSPQPPAISRSQHDQTYNESDTSSLVESVPEPISPAASDVPLPSILVRGFSGSSDAGAISEQSKNMNLNAEALMNGLTR